MKEHMTISAVGKLKRNGGKVILTPLKKRLFR